MQKFQLRSFGSLRVTIQVDDDGCIYVKYGPSGFCMMHKCSHDITSRMSNLLKALAYSRHSTFDVTLPDGNTIGDVDPQYIPDVVLSYDDSL